jgi:RNA polymerase sigma-70 factor (ECF subfamily)
MGHPASWFVTWVDRCRKVGQDDASMGVDGSTFEDDATLVAALRTGDDAAFRWLLDTYHGPLRRLARSYVATDAVADEVVQEAWLGVIRGIGRFEGRAAVKTWLYQIVMNIARSRGVKEHRTVPFASASGGSAEVDAEPYRGAFDPDHFRPPGEQWAGGWRTFPPEWEPVERLDRQETLDRVRRAIETLPATQRIVISLRDIDGWASDEVCNVLDITPTNQRVLLHRARAAVRAQLDPYLRTADPA